MTFSKDQIIKFWKNDKLKNIKPNTGEEFPEGWDVGEFLKDIVKEETITEVGCGYGRLCKEFSKDQYFGFDISPFAIKKAKSINPEYNFSTIQYADKSNTTDWTLFYTVFLHVRDEDLDEVIKSINSKKVIVGEIMDRKWRRNGNPPVFNRDPIDYKEAFINNGYELVEEIDKIYERYAKQKKHNKKTDVTFLIFEREDL